MEHTIHHWKQALGWTTPRVRHPEQADNWTWLILAAYTQLRLARGIVADRRLPWERSLPAESLTPTRVLRSFATLLPLVGTPAEAPKSPRALSRTAQGAALWSGQTLPSRQESRLEREYNTDWKILAAFQECRSVALY